MSPLERPTPSPGLYVLFDPIACFLDADNPQPTSEGPISLIFLQGPATNVVPIGTIVESAANTGTFVWTPSTDLAAASEGYAIKIVDLATGNFQYTTQFGISNNKVEAKPSPAPEPVAPVATPVATPETKPSSVHVAEPVAPTIVNKAPTVEKVEPKVTFSTLYETVTSCNCEGSEPTGIPTGQSADKPTGQSADKPTGQSADKPADKPAGKPATPIYNNGTAPAPTGYVSPNSTVSKPITPLFTGAAAQVQVGGAVVAVVAVMGMFF